MQPCLWEMSFSLFYKQRKECKKTSIWARLTASPLRLRKNTQIILILFKAHVTSLKHVSQSLWKSTVHIHSLVSYLIFLKKQLGHIFVACFSDEEKNFSKSPKLISFLEKLIRCYYFPKYFWSIMFIYFIFQTSLDLPFE